MSGRCARRKPGPAKAVAAEPADPGVKPAPSFNARRVALDVLDRVLGPEHRPFDETFQGHPQLDAAGRARPRLRPAAGHHGAAPAGPDRPHRAAAAPLPAEGAAGHQHAAAGCGAAAVPRRRRRTPRWPRRCASPPAGFRARGADAQRRAAQARRRRARGCSRARTPPGSTRRKWLWDSWAAAYGEERARAIAEAHLAEPPLDLSRACATPSAGPSALGAEILPTGTLRRRSGGLVEALPGYDEGAWWVQDAAAALPALLMGDVAGRRVLDIGAAPGGKTAQLAPPGAKVTALERSPRRAEFLVAQSRPADARRRDRRRRRAGMAAAGAVRRRAAGRALHRHRHHPPPSRRPLGQVAGRRRAAGRGAGPAAGGRGRLLRARRRAASMPSARCSPRRARSGSRRCSQPTRGVVRDPIGRAELRGLPVELTPHGEMRTLPCDSRDPAGSTASSSPGCAAAG